MHVQTNTAVGLVVVVSVVAVVVGVAVVVAAVGHVVGFVAVAVGLVVCAFVDLVVFVFVVVVTLLAPFYIFSPIVRSVFKKQSCLLSIAYKFF
jgi:hypothetical protein